MSFLTHDTGPNPPSGLSFSDALYLLKRGHRVARKGWNGRSMWIALTPGSFIEKKDARAGAASHLAADLEALDNQSIENCNGCASGLDSRSVPHTCEPKRCISIAPHIDMKAADGTLVIGWLASQTDLLAEDWEVLS